MVGPIADTRKQRGGAIVPPLFLTVSNSTHLERNDFMATYKELKKKFIDHLMGVDLYKMNITDLYTYACILKTVDEMEQPSCAEAMKTAMEPILNYCKAGNSGSGVFGIG
jgi:hypothetical protein